MHFNLKIPELSIPFLFYFFIDDMFLLLVQ